MTKTSTTPTVEYVTTGNLTRLFTSAEEAGRFIGTCVTPGPQRDELKSGQARFLAEVLVTDTRVWEVIRTTAQTITLRATKRGAIVKRKNVDGNLYPVIWTEALPDPDGLVITRRIRSDGTVRTGSFANPLRPATEIDGVVVDYTDYRE